MGKALDLTGQRFGRLTVIEKTDKRVSGGIVWKCQCDCGNVCEVVSISLRNGNTKSCGCLRISDLKGKRFGKLVAIELLEKRAKGGAAVWKCQCDCGNVCEINSCSLETGNTKSCGCGLKEWYNKHQNDLTGQRFGRLVALYPIENKQRGQHTKWVCLCDCGNEKTICSTELLNGKTQSCGCLKDDYRESNYVEDTKLDCLSSNKGKANTSGRRGVSWNKRMKKWEVYIGLRNKRIRLGMYDDFEYACKVRARAEEELWLPVLEENGRKLK